MRKVFYCIHCNKKHQFDVTSDLGFSLEFKCCGVSTVVRVEDLPANDDEIMKQLSKRILQAVKEKKELLKHVKSNTILDSNNTTFLRNYLSLKSL